MKTGDLVEVAVSKTKKLFGTFLATNSEGQCVIETKDGKVDCFKKKSVSKVMPHTVGIVFDSDNGYEKVYSYFCPKGAVEVGDLIFASRTSGFARVVEVDNRSEQATRQLEGWIVSKNPIPVE